MKRSYQVPHETVYNAVKVSISRCNFNIKEINHNKGIIHISTGMSLTSWGENIIIDVQDNNGITDVIIESESNAQLIDYGKNRQNIKLLFGEIEKCIF